MMFLISTVEIHEDSDEAVAVSMWYCFCTEKIKRFITAPIVSTMANIGY